MWYRVHLMMGWTDEDVAKLKKRLLKHVDITPEGCWQWNGALFVADYPDIKVRLSDGKIERRAHRLAFMLWKGSIPRGKRICHERKCQVKKSCINPDHLYAGTAMQNTHDALVEGSIGLRVNSSNAKLNNLEVRLIRCLYRREYGSMRKLAKMFNISGPSARDIIRFKTWKHI